MYKFSLVAFWLPSSFQHSSCIYMDVTNFSSGCCNQAVFTNSSCRQW